MTAARRPAPDRAGMIRAVHAAARARGLDGDAYRAMLRQYGGADSCRDMTARQLMAVLDHLNGHKPKVPTRRVRPIATGVPGLAKARALWLDLWVLGEVSDASESALEAYAQRMTKGVAGQAGQGVARLEWLDGEPLDRLIKGLRGWLNRVAPRLDRPDTPIQVGGQNLGGRPKVRVAWEQARRLEALGVDVGPAGLLTRPDAALDRLLAERGRVLREAMTAQAIEAPLSTWLRKRG
ncbi:regulatory protein GemA [Roseospira marina]|uniref:Regulatory protein GemA n=1 Tax=Roseospira marina TaxID=140057 RepID=A0A5M6I793_9PROT|nr:regulatory protein GemA [Roseospira marina]KAA5603757.1 regulatory protein GemA [Roseospira marina]MBB4316053.1 phage gp16-like protein [Roseospira marina]MBB5089229.1 phage gp16-like protein [Roseospira marina]